MGAAFYVMAILGCGDAGSACQQVRMIEARYASADACAAATGAALIANSDIDYPVVSASCRPASATMASVAVKPKG